MPRNNPGVSPVMSSARKYAVLSMALFCFPLVKVEAQISTTGSEVVVNTTTANDQQHPGVATDSLGNYVVVWESFAEDGDQYGIYYQRYNAGGTANGSQTQVNSTSTESQRHPHVAMDGSGRTAITYTSDLQDGDGQGTYLRTYDASFSVVLSAYRLNSSSAGNQMHSRLAMGPGGQLVAVYMDDTNDGDGYGVYYRPFNESFNALSSATLVNATTAGDQMYPDVAITGGGNFAVVWQSNSGSDADGNGVYMQVYDYNRSVVTSEFQVNTTTAGNQQEPRIAADHNGNFIVVWSSYGQDGDAYGIYGRIYNSSGVAQTGEFLINTTTTGDQGYASVTATQEGTFYVSWTDDTQDGSRSGVYVQGILSDGTFYGTETILNTTTAEYQQASEISMYRDSIEMVAVWQDGDRSSTSSKDGDDYGIVTQRLLTSDVTDPVAVCQNITLYIDGNGHAVVNPADLDGGSTDNVGVDSLAVSTDTLYCTNTGNNVITLSVFDAAGNSATCNANVTVLDSTSPTAVCQNITAYLNGSGSVTILSADLDGGSSDNCGIVNYFANDTTFGCADAGTNNVTLTVTDASGNSSQCTAIVTVIDSVSPTAVCQNLTVYLDASGNATIVDADLDGGSSDNCVGSLVFSASQTTFTCADIGTNNVTLTVTDPDNNSSQCAAVVTVLDTVSPTASCQNLTVYLDGAGSAMISSSDLNNGSSDNCGVASILASDTTFDCSETGTNNITFTVTDGSGNMSQCVATVTVLDSISPVVSCQNATYYLDASGNASTTSAALVSSSSDNCGIVSTIASDTTYDCSNTGANNITLTVTDASGNTGQCTAVVTVVDTFSPTAICQNITVTLDGTGNFTIASSDLDGGSTDNCSTLSFLASDTTFDCSQIGVNNITLTVSDPAGNSSQCVATVTVVDNTAPVVTSCPFDLVVAANTTGCAAIVTWSDPVVTDNCNVTTNQSHVSGSVFPSGTTTVTYDYTDDGGNTAQCSFNVTVYNDITVVSTSSTDETCAQNDGTATVTMSGGSLLYTYLWDAATGNQTTATASGLVAGTYAVTITDAITGCTTDTTVTVTFTCGIPNTQVRAADCNTTLPYMATIFYCDVVSGATNYEWEFVSQSDGSTFYKTRNSGATNMWMTAMVGIQAGTTYDVRVRAYVGGWGAYGTVCTITTPNVGVPTTQLVTNDCGATYNTLSTWIYCDPVAGATDYEFRFTAQNGGAVYTRLRGASQPNMLLSVVSGLQYGETYDVEVRGIVGSTVGTYGTTCTITVGSTLPSTQLTTTYCNSNLWSFYQLYYCDAVGGASNYEWRFTSQADGTVITKFRNNGATNMWMAAVGNIQTNTTYDVEIRPFVNGAWGAFGTLCTLTTPASSSLTHGGNDAYSANGGDLGFAKGPQFLIYPNPNRGRFTVQLDGEWGEITYLHLMDASGRTVRQERLTGTNRTEIQLESVADGVYFLRVTDDLGHAHTDRVVIH